MFENLSDSLASVFSKLSNKGLLKEDDVALAMREIRIALLEADVSLPVVKDFVKKVKEKAIGQEIVKKISPAQMVVKIVQDELENILSSEDAEINLKTAPPAVMMMVGLQGSGKTTSSGKLAKYLKDKKNKKVLLASLDIYRPAAQKQLEILGQQIEVDSLEIIEKHKPEKITKRALEKAKKENYDVVILDTAGRLNIDQELMEELKSVKKIANPIETILVADSLTGQDAVNIADDFNREIDLSGIILTRIDGDGRGGAALSMRFVTGCPIKFMGTGEKVTEFEVFHADRIASLILGMGDVVSLVEKAAENIDKKETEKLEKKLRKGQFDFNDMAKQFKTMRKMGGIGGLVGMIPGLNKMKNQINDANLDDKVLIHQEAIISSMTKKERRNPGLLNASRRKRIAAGSGLTIQDVNKLTKQHKQMSSMMKKIGKMDKKQLMRGQLGKFMPKV